MILEDTTEIRTIPEAVFAFFASMERHYLVWHLDHVTFRWMSEPKLEEGATFYFEERIAGKLLKKQVRFSRIIPNRHIEFEPTFWLMRLFLPRMIFAIKQYGDFCAVTAQIHLRMGPLAVWLHQKELDNGP